MEDKIAVRCLTKDMWNRIKTKIRKKSPDWNVTDSCWNQYKSDTCIAPIGMYNDEPGYADTAYWLRKGYKLISAEEYLGLHPLIAVECLSKELWDTIQRTMLKKDCTWQSNYGSGDNGFKDIFESNSSYCITEHGINGHIQASSKEFWIGRGYKIISAEKYLDPPKKIRKIGTLGIDFNTIIKRG